MTLKTKQQHKKEASYMKKRSIEIKNKINWSSLY